jgi:hypothetical protein
VTHAELEIIGSQSRGISVIGRLGGRRWGAELLAAGLPRRLC